MAKKHDLPFEGPPLTRRRLLARSSLLAAGVLATPLMSAEVRSTDSGPASANKPDEAPIPVTHILADWVVRSEKTSIPEAPRKEAVRSILNWIGATIGGSTQDATEIALATLAPFSCASGVSLFGLSRRLDPLRGALISGISSHVLDFDDTDLKTIIHPAGPVASALFALCQTHKVSGADFLHAFILGVEVECRLGRAIYPSHYDMGWHITGTCGAFGAAAACGKLLGLNTEQMQMAIGIAATEAAGLKIMFGSMSKSLNIGRAAENGLLAALLAAKGFTSSAQSIEGKDGYVFAASKQHDYTAVTEGLGQHYEISRNTYKPFACGIVIHPVIDAVLQIRKDHTINPSNVCSIVIKANPLVLQLTGKQEPKVGLEGKFSVYHSTAIALIRGSAGPDDYSDAAVTNPQVVALRRLVNVQTNPSIRPEEAYITLTMVDGSTYEKHVEHAVGSVERPLTDDELAAKFRLLVKTILPASQMEDLLTRAWNLEKSDDAAELPRLGALREPEK